MGDVICHRLDVLQILLHLKAKMSAGPDGIPSILLKKMAHCLALPLTLLFSLMYKCGLLPKVWKQANVVPIHKKGPKSDPENYRPISLTCVSGKVFESIIKSNLIHYLNTKSCFSAGQHGFMTGASTATNLIESLNILKRGFQSKCCNRIVYFDFAKAFDSVSYSKLIFKLSHLGLPNNLIKTINSFLVDRTQRVCIDNILSVASPKVQFWVQFCS